MTDRIMTTAYGKIKESFDKLVQMPRTVIKPGSLFFVQKELYPPHGQKHKLAPMNEWLFMLISATDMTVVVQIDRKQ